MSTIVRSSILDVQVIRLHHPDKHGAKVRNLEGSRGERSRRSGRRPATAFRRSASNRVLAVELESMEESIWMKWSSCWVPEQTVGYRIQRLQDRNRI
jgi:hypothetical protein